MKRLGEYRSYLLYEVEEQDGRDINTSTGNDPTAENNPSTRSSPAATNLLSESRNSGYPKATKKQLGMEVVMKNYLNLQ